MSETNSTQTFTVNTNDNKAVYDLILQLTEYLHPVHSELLSMEDLVEEMESVVEEYRSS